MVSNPSTTLTCWTGSYVPVRTGSTYDEFAEGNSVATDQLLMVNEMIPALVFHMLIRLRSHSFFRGIQ